MSSIISAIPPPPPLAPPLKAESMTAPNINKFDGCLWAKKFPDIQQGCYLSQICVLTKPKACKFKNIQSIIQQGPTCGLTCLSMLINEALSPKELLELAKNWQYTLNGEMFSAKNLCDILRKVITEKNYNNITCQLHEGPLNCAKVKNFITNDACLFVPYDPDYNHSPCLKSGHKAHWALIIGYLIDNDDNFYVLARHGKTKSIAVWSLKSLSASNSNLIEFAQPKGYPNTDFLLPEGGIGGPNGLRNQCVIAQNIENETVAVV
ncbi:actin maturation protease [Condylostylus longicornis]|uniref:actin maturation protease n=1 Tax=Condylostylus longicornis TaxID=2530218 RepID=UPI00244D9A16|nr:actin maturation protease [Condylostylus longicornis]